jgi:nicotinate-nucleotide adenylyltransferase
MWFAGPARLVPEAGRPSAQRLGFHLEPGQRVGLFGGSFNPAHEGHAHVAETALRRLELDKVIWLVSPQNPLKASHETRPLAERLAGARQWARGSGMIVSDAETRLGSQYTIDTLRVLRARFRASSSSGSWGPTAWPPSTAGAAGPRSCARCRWR